MRFNNESAPLTLRANRFTTTVDVLEARFRRNDVVVERGQFAPDALRVEHGSALRGADIPQDLYVVQDEASQLVSLLAGPHPGRRVLDTCASPGGKATAIAATLQPPQSGTVVACDVRDRRMTLLAGTVNATGAGNVRLVQADVTQPLPFAPVFDTVIVDAPCSGLGTLRRDPDIKWRRRPEDLVALASAQRQMLSNASAAVVPGGRLIYATCSTEADENEAIAAAFLATHGEFRAIDAGTIDPLLAPVVDPRGHLRTAPDRHGLEGFFGAVFERVRQM
jgi:16S rRNA (cytosine967-C5)-methyltransferase